MRVARLRECHVCDQHAEARAGTRSLHRAVPFPPHRDSRVFVGSPKSWVRKVLVNFLESGGWVCYPPVLPYPEARTTRCSPCGRASFSQPDGVGRIYFFVKTLTPRVSSPPFYSRRCPSGTTALGLVAGMNASAANLAGAKQPNSTTANATGTILHFCPENSLSISRHRKQRFCHRHTARC